MNDFAPSRVCAKGGERVQKSARGIGISGILVHTEIRFRRRDSRADVTTTAVFGGSHGVRFFFLLFSFFARSSARRVARERASRNDARAVP